MRLRKFSLKTVNILSIILICYLLNPYSIVLANCPSGMLAYWELVEDATDQEFNGYTDETGLSHTGDCAENCPAFTTQGMVTSAQQFNGIDTGIEVEPSSDFDFTALQSFSIELWFKRDSGISGREVFIGRDSSTDNMQWWVGIQASGRIGFYLSSVNGVSDYIESSAQKIVDNGLWHHVAVVKTNSQIRLYVDGLIETSASRVHSFGFESPESITIGYHNNDGVSESHFNGSIDEVAIYNKALSDNEIKMHYYLSRGYCETHKDPVRIMPLGDSITLDNHTSDTRPQSEKTGYRWPLWNWLGNASHWVDFIGSEDAGSAFFEDDDNAGFKGINANELWILLDTGEDTRNNVWPSNGPYLPAYPCDIILLHIGTNDVSTSTTEVVKILDEIDEFSQNITVILARIINRAIGDPEIPTTTQFNSNLGIIAQNRINNGDKIIVVDMENGADIDYRLEPAGDMYDALHPTNVTNPDIIDSGYGKMADVWYQKLVSFLPQSSPPEIISSPVTSVNVGQIYSYDVQANGLPLNYSVIQGPGGMTIDDDSGQIEWVPSLGGVDFDVTVEVSNWLDTVTQAFTLSVNASPIIVGQIPDQNIAAGNTFEIINLDTYVSDIDNAASELTWSTSGNSELMIDISERVATITAPTVSWSGSETITFRATDPGGLFVEDTATFTITPGEEPPVVNVPGQVIEEGDLFSPINLDAHVNDPDNTAEELVWTYTGNNQISVSISANHVAEISVPNSWTGSESITFRATDPSGRYGESTAIFTVEQNGDDGGDGGGGGCFVSILR